MYIHIYILRPGSMQRSARTCASVCHRPATKTLIYIYTCRYVFTSRYDPALCQNVRKRLFHS